MSGANLVDIVGHRGARGEAPENTMAGFQHVINAGVRDIELDVRLSADGHLIVLHDRDVDRTTWHSGPAHHYSLADLGLLDARRNTPGWHSPMGVPGLREVIDFCPDDTRFQLEIKGAPKPILQRLAHALRDLARERELHQRVVVTSSHTGFLRMIHTMDPRMRRGYVCQYRYLQPVSRSANLGCEWLMAHFTLITPRLVKKAHRKGLKLSAWTVNDLMEAERLERLGVDSVITDFPTGFAAHFMGKRAGWGARPPLKAVSTG